MPTEEITGATAETQGAQGVGQRGQARVIKKEKKKAQKIVLKMGDNLAKVDGEDIPVSEAAFEGPSPGRIFVPLSLICELFGDEVEWNDGNKTLTIERSK